MITKSYLVIFTVGVCAFFQTAEAIDCYQCISTNNSHPFQCNEFLTSDIDMKPEPCTAVYAAQYCVKHIGRFEEALTLDCYQCSSDEEWKCSEGHLVVESLQPRNCNHVFEAQYCVKSIGRYGGGIGTKRYCSAVHMGNYCEYVQQPGDRLTYRTCVFTCSSDGCNPASSVKSSGNIIALIFGSLLILEKLLLQR